MTSRPTAGVGLFPTGPVDAVTELALAAEASGIHTLWVGDSQNIWREAMVTLGVLASQTTTVRLGTGVSNVATRHPAVLASAFATLQELSGGRMVLGVGAGDSSLETMGLKPTRRSTLERSIDSIRRLLAGERVREPTSGSDYRLVYLERDAAVPIFLAASRPKMTALAGRMADGLILAVGLDDQLIARGLEWLDEGLSAAGRDRGEVEVVLWVPACISEDGAWARDQVRAHVARTVKRRLPLDLLTDEDRAAIERINEEYDYEMHLHPDAHHSRLVTEALVSKFALAGTPGEVQRQVARLPSGIDQVAIVPTPRSLSDRLATIIQFGEIFEQVGAGR